MAGQSRWLITQIRMLLIQLKDKQMKNKKKSEKDDEERKEKKQKNTQDVKKNPLMTYHAVHINYIIFRTRHSWAGKTSALLSTI